MSKEIILTQGKVAIVDDDDFEWLSKFKWHFKRYAARTNRENGKQINILMHREILNPPENYEIDHINGDKLDNRKTNLRICSHSQNEQNCPVRKNNRSGFKGVTWHKKAKKWGARICINGKKRRFGLHNSPEEAANAYDKAARKYFGEFARTNY